MPCPVIRQATRRWIEPLPTNPMTYKTALTEFLARNGVIPSPQWGDRDLEAAAIKVVDAQLTQWKEEERLLAQKRRDQWNSDPVRSRITSLMVYQGAGITEGFTERYHPFPSRAPAAHRPPPRRPHGNSRAARQLRGTVCHLPGDALSFSTNQPTNQPTK